MKLKAITVLTIVLVLVSLVIGAVLYGRLPEAIPTHFDFDGRPDGHSVKLLAILLTPAVLLLTGLVLGVLPRIAPKGYRIEPFRRVYIIFGIALLGLEFSDGMLELRSALGYHLDNNRAVILGTGFLLVVLGNFLGKVTRNFFVGIRTPWTLASPEVWRRTHRLGGVLFVVGGLGILTAGFLGTARARVVILPVVMAIALILTLYSYVVYRRIEGGGPADSEME